jgi:hypothetical protein
MGRGDWVVATGRNLRIELESTAIMAVTATQTVAVQ